MRKQFARLWLLLPCVFATHACKDETSPDAPAGVRLEVVASGLDEPLFLTSPPGDSRLFIAEKTGRIRIIKQGQLQAAAFLDLSSMVNTTHDHGLLGLVFHPQFATNGRFFVYYSDLQGHNQLDQFSAIPTSDVADGNSRVPLLHIPNPGIDHHGGMLAFAPDGKLLIAVGDGGLEGDYPKNAQDMTTLLGKLLRIDVDAGQPYSIPSDNPFVGSPTIRGEIWAFGLRNPWRFSIDHVTGLLYIADVGLHNWEEINVVPLSDKGVNWGWDVMEGLSCQITPCDTTGKRLPVYQYSHNEGCSVIGGYVYRGAAMPYLHGTYFFSDFCKGFLRSFVFVNGTATDIRSWNVGATGFAQSMGEDASGELYLLVKSGFVFRLVPKT